jgi:cobalt-zinc-cadmium efflux system outer membrane protein
MVFHSQLRAPVFTIVNSSPLLPLALMLLACAHSSPPEPEAPAPHLRSVAEAESHAAAAHREPVADPTASKEVSLGGILAYADDHSPVLAVARSTRSRAEAARTAAAVLLPANPELSVAAGPRMGGDGTGIDVQVSLTQQIQIAGERGLRLEAADRLRELTDAEIEEIRWAVHCDVHAGFHRALIERERMRLGERVVIFQEDVLRTVERQIAAGEVSPLTLRLAQAEVAQAKQQVVAAQQAYLASRIRLGLLSGWPAVTPPIPAGTVDAPRDPPPDAQLVAIARERLPSLRAGAARAREANARARLADRQAWPQPSVGVQYNRESSPGAEGAYDIVMGVLSTPIPSFQTNQGERASARADAIVARAELDAAQRLLDGQVAEARSEVAAAAQRTRAYGSEILPRFEENLTLLRRTFELGEIDILALSTGRERFLRIQSDALAAQLDYFVALAGLERVVGVELWRDAHDEENQP